MLTEIETFVMRLAPLFGPRIDENKVDNWHSSTLTREQLSSSRRWICGKLGAKRRVFHISTAHALNHNAPPLGCDSPDSGVGARSCRR